MAKASFTLDPDVHEELIRVIPLREWNRVVSEALRKELLRRRRELATERLKAVRNKTGNLSGHEIVGTLRKDRARRG